MINLKPILAFENTGKVLICFDNVENDTKTWARGWNVNQLDWQEEKTRDAVRLTDGALRGAGLFPVRLFFDMECVFISSLVLLENILSFRCLDPPRISFNLRYNPPAHPPAPHFKALMRGLHTPSSSFCLAPLKWSHIDWIYRHTSVWGASAFQFFHSQCLWQVKLRCHVDSCGLENMIHACRDLTTLMQRFSWV